MNLLINILIVFRLYWRRRFWSVEKIRKHQQRRLLILLKFLKINSKFYSDKIDSDFQIDKVPIIDKKIYMDNYDHINTEGLLKQELMDFSLSQQRSNSTELFKNQFSIGLSSGTSGNVTLAVLSSDERKRYPALLIARTNIRNYTKSPRVFFLLRRNNAAFMEVDRNGVSINYADYTVPVKDLIEQINSRRINVIAGPPSLLSMIGEEIEDINVKPKVVFSYAEVLSDKVKFNLEKTFACSVNQIYQGAEGFLAATCKFGSLHLNEDTTYFEFQNVDDENKSVKKVIVTDLYRITAPFVRYSLHDLLEIDDKKCSCGSSFRIIKKIHGREDDVFSLFSVEGNEKFLFPDYVRRSINQVSEDISEFQAIQHIDNSIEIRLVLKINDNKEKIEKKIVDNLEFWAHKINGQLSKITFVYAAPIRNKSSHKLIRVMKEKK